MEHLILFFSFAQPLRWVINYILLISTTCVW